MYVHVCMYVCMYVQLYVCEYVYVYVHIDLISSIDFINRSSRVDLHLYMNIHVDAHVDERPPVLLVTPGEAEPSPVTIPRHPTPQHPPQSSPSSLPLPLP